MSESENTSKIALDEIMLTMDVVDTLRHQERLVERELNAEDRDRALVEKVRRIYASQGLEVTDEIIAAGVAALREERFTYSPARPSLQLWLARLYVRRRAVAKATAVVCGCLLAAYLAYQLMIVAPRERRHEEAVASLNTEIARQQDQIAVARQRLATARQSLDRALPEAASGEAAVVQRLKDKAQQGLTSAEGRIRALEALPLAVDLKKNSGATLAANRVRQRAELIQALGQDLKASEAAVASLSQLSMLPRQLTALRDSVVAEAREEQVRQMAQTRFRDARAALERGAVDEAQKGLTSLKQLLEQVVQTYELRIVSRPGEPSGVWRHPEGRSNVRNYYLIVEAVTPGGERLTVPVTSEEDGRTRDVQQWGLRVDESVFESVRRDKQDDGIINNNRLGVKKRGYLDPQYMLPTTGGAITQW